MASFNARIQDELRRIVGGRRLDGQFPPLTLAALLFASETILGDNCEWHPEDGADETKRTRQSEAARWYLELRALVPALPELETLAAWTAEDINAFLVSHGFTIKLDPFGPDAFGVAAISDFPVLWIEEAEGRMIYDPSSGRAKPGFILDRDWIVSSSPDADRDATYWVRTQTDDLVGLAMAPRPESPEALLAEVRRRMGVATQPSDCALAVPCVDIDMRPDVSYLIGLSTVSPLVGRATIVQAVMQAVFHMNRKGARSRIAMAAEVQLEACSWSPAVLTFDRPFLFWMQRPGLDVPLCAYYIVPADWKEPAEL